MYHYCVKVTSSDETLYSTLDAVIAAIKEESEDNNIELFHILKRWTSKSFCVCKRWIDTGKHLSARVNPDGEIISYWDGAGGVLEEADYDIFLIFDCVNIFVPVPFQRGDILTYEDKYPFVPPPLFIEKNNTMNLSPTLCLPLVPSCLPRFHWGRVPMQKKLWVGFRQSSDCWIVQVYVIPYHTTIVKKAETCGVLLFSDYSSYTILVIFVKCP